MGCVTHIQDESEVYVTFDIHRIYAVRPTMLPPKRHEPLDRAIEIHGDWPVAGCPSVAKASAEDVVVWQ